MKVDGDFVASVGFDYGRKHYIIWTTDFYVKEAADARCVLEDSD